MTGTEPAETPAANSVTGWVLWRDEPGAAPTFQYGTVVLGPEGATFTPAPAGAASRTFVVPGFVDLHAHLAIGSAGPAADAEIEQGALDQVRRGVLAIREPGSPTPVPENLLPYGRPVIVTAGRHIALPKRYIRGLAVELEGDSEAEVTAALVEEVRRQARLGGGWVKLVGDWIDRSNGAAADLDPLWTVDQLRAAVEAAHDEGARLTVHTFSSAAIPDILEAGVDCIEHGSGMSADDLARAAGAGIPVVPTVLQVCKFPEFAQAATKYPVYAETMNALFEGRRQWFSQLIDSGVTVLPGSDAGGYQEHGSLIAELQQWAQWGMAPDRVLAAATWQARDFLGLPSLEEGAPADAIVFDRDPAADPDVWGQPAAVYANGHLVQEQ